VHAVIDNYSRRILAWQANTTYDTSTTAKLLIEAAMGLKGVIPKVYMDSGAENLNTQVDALVASGTIQRIIAQVDVVFSNSMIESWWRMLKHGIRHSRDRPPMKCTSVKGAIYQTSVNDARTIARQARLATNRAVSCSRCAPTDCLVQIENKPTESG
jgi:transposase InsO family protein